MSNFLLERDYTTTVALLCLTDQPIACFNLKLIVVPDSLDAITAIETAAETFASSHNELLLLLGIQPELVTEENHMKFSMFIEGAPVTVKFSIQLSIEVNNNIVVSHGFRLLAGLSFDLQELFVNLPGIYTISELNV